MPVYLARMGIDGPLKIGFSLNLRRRIAILQTANPEPITICGLIDGDTVTEGALHRRFARHHIRGEWFRNEPEIIAVFRPVEMRGPGATRAQATREAPIWSHGELLPPLQRAIEIAGGRALANAIGVTACTIWNWSRKGGHAPPKYHARIELATGGYVKGQDWCST